MVKGFPREGDGMKDTSEVKIVLPKREGLEKLLRSTPAKVMVRQSLEHEWFELGVVIDIDVSMPLEGIVRATVGMMVSEFEVNNE